MPTRKNKAYRKEARRAFAKEMEEARIGRTPQQQLARLDEKLGKDKGAKKERARLLAQIKDG